MYHNNNQGSTALAENSTFMLPTPMDDGVTSDELAEDMEGLRLTFPKVKIPGGGVLQFEMASDNPDRPNYYTVFKTPTRSSRLEEEDGWECGQPALARCPSFCSLLLTLCEPLSLNSLQLFI